MADCQRLSATWEAIHFAPTHPGADAFLDEVGFEFRDGANDGQKQPAHRAVRGDVFPAREKVYVQVCEFVDDGQKMFCASGHAIKRAHNHHAESPPPCILQHGIQTWATSFAAGNAHIGVFGCDLISALLGENAEVVKLIVDALVGGAYPGVDRTFLNHRCLLMLSSRVLDGSTIGRTWLISSLAAFFNVMPDTHYAH
jgi:hypothetical protein